MSKYSMAVLAACLMAVVLFGLAFVPEVHVAKAASKTITVPNDYPTIQAAIDNASSGETIFVRKGTYSETLVLNKSLTLLGEDSANTVIVSPQSPDAYLNRPPGISIKALNISISGFTIQDRTIVDFFGYNLTGNNLVNSGLHLSSPGSIISNNNITQNQPVGIKYLDYGIYINSPDTLVSGNNITGNFNAGMIVNNDSVTITKNNISNLTGYLVVGIINGGGLELGSSARCYVYGNNITDNVGFGIAFKGYINDTLVFENNIARNTIGIQIGGNYTTIAYTGAGNEVFRNNLIDNAQQAVLYPNGFNVAWDNGEEGNYWSDYQTKYPNASEINNSGIGNTRYVIDTNNTDNYPIMEPAIIPEFPPWIILPALLASLATVAAVFKRKSIH